MKQLACGFILAIALCAQPDLLTRSPALISKCGPQYTDEARFAKLEGKVVLYVEISRSGGASNFKVVESLGRGLDQRAIEAVTQWRFSPGIKDGEVVVASATVEVDFRLNDATGPCRAAPSKPKEEPKSGVAA
jgi:TonB family protein